MRDGEVDDTLSHHGCDEVRDGLETLRALVGDEEGLPRSMFVHGHLSDGPDPDTWKIVQRYLDGHGNEDLDVMLVELIKVLATKVRDLATREETRNILERREK